MASVSAATRRSTRYNLWIRDGDSGFDAEVQVGVVLFDICSGPLVAAWGGGRVRLAVPASDILDARLVYYGRLVLPSCRILPYWARMQRSSLVEAGSAEVPLGWLSCENTDF